MPESSRRDPRLALRGTLAVLAVGLETWRADVEATIREAGDPDDAFLRWNETLTQVRLALARADRRMAEAAPPPRDPPGPGPAPDDGHRQRVLLEAWFDRNGITTTWRRIDDPADLEQEAENADIVTDLAEVLTTIAHTAGHLDQVLAAGEPPGWEVDAYFQVIAPWRRTGRNLDDVLAWLRGRLAERTDW